jgi:penicillin-binding protein 1C
MISEQPTRPVKPVSRKTTRRGYRPGCGCAARLFLGSLLLLAILIFTGIVVTGTLVYSSLSAEIEDGIITLDSAREREVFETTVITDRDGRVLWEIFGEGKRTRVSLDQIPQHLIDAIVATEDDTFYENTGLDIPSLIAAIVANFRNPGDRPQGASTITQQLVRHVVFDYEERTAVSYNRKTKEVILAWVMARKYAKDEILEMYLNEIYFGNLAYGVEAASQTYFGKPAAELNLAEATLLSGLPQSPIELDPLQNIDGAKERQWLVLNLMASEGFINRSQAQAAYLEALEFAPQEVSLEAPHFAVYVRRLLEEEYGPEVVANGGLRVTTTLDLDYQRLADRLARQHIAQVGPDHNMTNAALVAIKPGTGEILAMLGSLDYRDEDIDGNVNIALSGQQPGSAIKPITYAAALSPQQDGGEPLWSAADLLWDVPVDYEQYDGSVYAPVNYDRRFHGPVRLREALANSYNIPAILLLQDIGVPMLVDQARRLGITTWEEDTSRYGLSLTLGGGDVTPLELTGAYSAIANGGKRVPPVGVLRVEKANGDILYAYEPPVGEQVLDPRVAFLISDILDDDAARIPAMGRDNPLDLSFPAAAKTGTSNDFRDNWTVGYTPDLAVGVWTGNSDNSEMLDISGLTGAAPLWSAYMEAVYSDYRMLEVLEINGNHPPSEFTMPEGMEERGICNLKTISTASDSCSLSQQEYFLSSAPGSDLNSVTLPEGVVWEELDPGLWRVPAVALPPLSEEFQVAAKSIQGDDRLPPQPYCFFEQGAALAFLPPDAVPALFLSPPRNVESLKSAHEWAAEHDLPIFPAVSCTEDLLAAARDPNIPAIWRITTPKTGEDISGVVPIIGTADFDPAKVQFYKVELGMGDLENPQWVTLGEVGRTPVVNGTLELLHADALPSGEYLLRLVVVRWDGNYVGEPFTVELTIE